MKNLFFYERIRILKVVLPVIKKFRKQLIMLMAVNIVLILLGLITPIFYKSLIDDVFAKKQMYTLIWICIGYLSVFFGETAVIYFRNYVNNHIFNKLVFNLRFIIWNNYMSMPLSEYEKFNKGDLKNRLEDDTNQIREFLSKQIIDYITSYITVVSNIFILLKINWKLALFVFVMTPLTFLIGHYIGKTKKMLSKKRRQNRVKYSGWQFDSIQAWKEIKALSIEKRQYKIFTMFKHELGLIDAKWILRWALSDIFYTIKESLITQMSLYFIGGIFVLDGHFTLGSLLAFISYYSRFYGGIDSINSSNVKLNGQLPSLEKMIEMIKFVTRDFDKQRIRGQLEGNVVLTDVSFRYNAEQEYVLNNINLDISTGERIAIVGKSGSGKSTLIKLILGLYEPQIGKICIGGHYINEIHPISLHKNIGVVMQDSMLFNMTIKENLLLAKASASDAEIEEACKLANIHDFIISLPDGYANLIGEKGVKLSGGQRQRLAIARVLLSKPGIIIFDEATSSLDHESEKMINNAIDKISKGRTVIIIAHRLSSILSADRIVVIDKSSIAGIGHHRDLLNNNPSYDALFKEQYEKLAVS